MIDTTKLNQGDWGYAGAWGMGATEPHPSTTSGGTTDSNTGNRTGNTTPVGGNMGDIKYPSEWGQAGDVWGQMAGGNYSNQGLDWMKNWLGQGGSQGNLAGWASAYKPAMMDEYSNMVKQMAEQAGVGGTRYGSGLQSQIGNYGGQLMNKFNQDYMGQMMNAMGMDVNAAQGLGSDLFGVQNTGAQGLFGLGGAKNDLGLGLYDRMLQEQQMNQGNQLNWAQMLNQAINGPMNTQQTYQPTMGTDIMSILAGMPWGDIFGGGKKSSGGGSLSTIPGASIWG